MCSCRKTNKKEMEQLAHVSVSTRMIFMLERKPETRQASKQCRE